MPSEPFASEQRSSVLPTPGRSVAGVDGCRAGWVMVRRDAAGRFEAPLVVTALDDLPATDMTVIDIPIGLPESGRRACDLEARAMLGPRRSSVFTGVRRPLLALNSYEAANAWGKDDGEGLTRQMWNILPKIREVDDWISPSRSRIFREGHPELAFTGVSGRPMAHYKKTPEGEAERLDALAGFIERAAVRKWLDRARGSGAARDDIVDALAMCRSAARILLGCHGQLPADPPKDARGLPMEMVF